MCVVLVSGSFSSCIVLWMVVVMFSVELVSELVVLCIILFIVVMILLYSM